MRPRRTNNLPRHGEELSSWRYLKDFKGFNGLEVVLSPFSTTYGAFSHVHEAS